MRKHQQLDRAFPDARTQLAEHPLARDRPEIEDPSRFGGWLMKVVSNLSLNFRRARSTRATAWLDDDALADLRCTYRGARVPRSRFSDIGFRCARGL